MRASWTVRTPVVLLQILGVALRVLVEVGICCLDEEHKGWSNHYLSIIRSGPPPFPRL